MEGGIVLNEKPSLRQPYLVVGFAGWIDGGQAATGTVKHLVRKLGATRFGEMPVSPYNLFQVPGVESLRPICKIEDGLPTELRLPRNEFFYWKRGEGDEGHDLVLLLGVEPNLGWPEYIAQVLDLAQSLGVVRVYSVGSVLGGVPHTREPAISCTLSHRELKEEIDQYQVRYSSYEGPSTFNVALLFHCRERGLEAVQLTGRAVYYPEFGIVVSYNPAVILALVRRLEGILGLELGLSDLEEASRDLVERLNTMVGQSSQLRSYVEELERNFVEMRYERPIKAAPEEIVRGAEEFLKRQQHRG